MQIKCAFIGMSLLFCLTFRALACYTLYITDTPYVQLQNKQPTIGDILPRFTFGNLLQKGQDDFQIKTYPAGKYVILDFFATWCAPCVKALKTLDTLQKKHGDNLLIFVVTREDRRTVARFLKNNPVGKSVSLPFVVGDSVLSTAFPHNIVPHEVWIDKNRKVVAITSDLEVTGDNVAQFVSGQRLVLPEKVERTDYDNMKPLFVNGNGGSGNDFVARSILAHTDNGLGAVNAITIHPGNKISRIVTTNQLPVTLFYNAYAYANDLVPRYNPKRVIFETVDTTRFFSSELSDSYTYELLLPTPVSTTRLAAHMLEDLNRYFSFTGAVEKRQVPCWILKSIGDRPQTSGSGMDKISIQSMVERLNNAYRMEPVITDPGINNDRMIAIDVSEYMNRYPDIEFISKELLKQGLVLSRSSCAANVLVIRNK